MAETLGSLVDKLTIKEIREFHFHQMLEDKNSKVPKLELERKIKILKSQKQDLMQEIDEFIASAYKSKKRLRDEKLKLYNPTEDIGCIPQTESLGVAISVLAQKNLELWHLEDEARRKDVPLSYIGKIKKKIDFANQQRNDLIDKIDELFERKVKQKKNKTK